MPPPNPLTRGARRSRLLAAAAACILSATLSPTSAAAQTFREAEPGLTPGWVFTPTFVFSVAHDDNVTLAGQHSPTEADTLSVLTPAADLQYRGRHNWLGAGYGGSWSLYRQLSALDSYDQNLRIDTRHELSKRVSMRFHDALGLHPTTDVVELRGVPFLRTGSRTNDGLAEARFQLAPHTTASASYTLTWVNFEKNALYGQYLHGGVAHGLAGNVQQQLSSRLTLGAEYSFQRAIVSENAGRFDIQIGAGTFSYLVGPRFTVSGALGFGRLRDDVKLTTKTGPSWRLAAEQRFERATVNAVYSRSYVPTFSIGGTAQNEEFDASLQMPLARNRLYWQGGLSWRRNEPLIEGGQTLKSLWLQTWVGYSVLRWLRIEGYLWRTQQDSQLAGGRVYRNRVGIQLVTAMPMRLQ